ncbi:RNA polymerase sigma factor [Streptomyces sp. NPDC006552]|uniref:RNA polymerase sigma factor n=1 Tax=Streptomyces sp. NPDC006552 TaxID=3157179 RepID=UPI0033A396F4
MGQGAEPRRPRLRDDELGAAVARAQGGDEAAFAAAYRSVQPGLFGYLSGLVGARAQDVTADAWQEIARDLTAFRGDGATFRAWTAAIARRHALDLLRRRADRPPGPAAEPDVPGWPVPRDPAGRAAARVLALVGELPRAQREAVLLRIVVGLDEPAAARVLGRRPGAVRTAAHRGLRRLARRFDAESAGREAPPGSAGPGERG